MNIVPTMTNDYYNADSVDSFGWNILNEPDPEIITEDVLGGAVCTVVGDNKDSRQREAQYAEEVDNKRSPMDNASNRSVDVDMAGSEGSRLSSIEDGEYGTMLFTSTGEKYVPTHIVTSQEMDRKVSQTSVQWRNAEDAIEEKQSRTSRENDKVLHHTANQISINDLNVRQNSIDGVLFLEELADDDEVWLVQCPANVSERLLLNQCLHLNSTSQATIQSMENGKCKFKVKVSDGTQKPALFCLVPSWEHSCLKAVVLQPARYIVLTELFGNCLEAEVASMIPKKRCVSLPTSLKLRHPLFGAEFEQCLSPSVRHSNQNSKHKKKNKHRRNRQMGYRMQKCKSSDLQGSPAESEKGYLLAAVGDYHCKKRKSSGEEKFVMVEEQEINKVVSYVSENVDCKRKKNKNKVNNEDSDCNEIRELNVNDRSLKKHNKDKKTAVGDNHCKERKSSGEERFVGGEEQKRNKVLSYVSENVDCKRKKNKKKVNNVDGDCNEMRELNVNDRKLKKHKKYKKKKKNRTLDEQCGVDWQEQNVSHELPSSELGDKMKIIKLKHSSSDESCSEEFIRNLFLTQHAPEDV